MAVVVLGAAAACSATSATTTDAAGPSTTAAASSGSPPGTGGADRQAWRDCLAQHGVTLPTRGQGGPGDTAGANAGGQGGGFGGLDTSDPKVQDAMNACAGLRPAGSGNGPGGQAAQAYLTCLRDHGVTVPSTPPGTDASGRRTRPSIDTSDPKYAAASQACEALRPTGPNATGNAAGRSGSTP
ncbi:MAG: hypothetical protein R2726_22080 [Acidimicrobiales bacterium]